MSIKALPELDVWVYPLGAGQATGSPPTVVADLLQMLPRRDKPSAPWWGPMFSAGGVVVQTPEIAVQTGELFDITSLRWWDFDDKSTGGRTGGFSLAPIYTPWYNYISGDGTRNITIPPDDDKWVLQWQAIWGYYWATVAPDDDQSDFGGIAYYMGEGHDGPARQQGVPLTDAQGNPVTDGNGNPLYLVPQPMEGANESPWGGAEYLAETVQTQPKEQSFAVKLWLGEAAQGETAWSRLSWANDAYSLLFYEGNAPILMRGYRGKDPYWRQVGVVEGAPTTWFPQQEPVWVSVFLVGGRMVVQVNAAGSVWQVSCNEIQNHKLADPAATLKSGNIRWGGSWAPTTLRGYEILWGGVETLPITARQDPDGPVLPATQDVNDGTGSFKRRFYAPRSGDMTRGGAYQARAMGLAAGASAASAGELLGNQTVPATIIVTNWRGSGTNAGVNYQGDFFLPRGAAEYQCTLTSPDIELPLRFAAGLLGVGNNNVSMRGAKTPFVHAVVVQLGSLSYRSTVAPINIRPALRRAVEHVEDPMLSSGPRWEMELSRNALSGCPVATGGTAGDNWAQWINRYHRCTVSVRARNTDGTAGAITERIDGWVYSRSMHGEAAPSKRTMRLELRDWMVRLSKPAAIVDGRFGPLDMLLVWKALGMAAGKKPKLYGSDGIKHILSQGIGPWLGDLLEVYYPTGQYDLISWDVLAKGAPSGWWYPAPFGRSVIDWVHAISDTDFCVFFFGGSLTGSGKFVPTYGNYFEIVKNAYAQTLYDVSVNAPVVTADLSQVSETDINRMLVQGRFPTGGDNLAGIMPALALISAESRIETGSAITEQNIASTYERTLLKEGSEYWYPGVAYAVAANFLRLLRGVEVARYPMKTRGMPDVWWGQKVTVANTVSSLDADIAAQIIGKQFRIMRAQNTYDLGDNPKWDTDLNVVPTPNLT